MQVIFGQYSTRPYGILNVDEISTDIANNKSTVSFSLVLKRPYEIVSSATKTASCTIDGQSYSWSGRIGGTGDLTLISGTKEIYHNNDGTKTINVSASIQLDLTWSGSWVGTISGNDNMNLTALPRASSISANSADIESNTTITINRASNSFTHTITYNFSSLSGTIATKTSDVSINWQIPNSFYTKIPNAKTGICTLTCTTYSGNTQIGNATTTTFTVIANENLCKPIVSGTVEDINPTTIALTGQTSKLVKYKSTAQILTNISARNSATISKVLLNGANFDGTPISNVETGSFELTTIDSRGYSTTITLTASIVNYVQLSATSNFKRDSNTSNNVTLKYSGNYFDDSFGVANNTLSLSYKYREKGSNTWIDGITTLNPTITNNTFSQTTQLSESFNYRKNWEFSLYYEDELTSSNTSINDVLKGHGALEIYNNSVKINGEIILNMQNVLTGSITVEANQTSGTTEIDLPTGYTYQNTRVLFLSYGTSANTPRIYSNNLGVAITHSGNRSYLYVTYERGYSISTDATYSIEIAICKFEEV